MSRVFAFIFARGGSKGLPGKNIKPLAGKPLIGYSIGAALAAGCFERVIVSTDSAEIAAVARSFGALTPFLRPKELASDDASEWLAWQHAIKFAQTEYGDFDLFVSLPTTSPFRTVSDIHRCIEVFNSHSATDVVVTGREAARSPYFNMVKLSEDGCVRLVNEPQTSIIRRQDVPKVYDLTTVAYAARPNFILKSQSIWEGAIRMVEVPAERAVDIDTPLDFAIAECLAGRGCPGE